MANSLPPKRCPRRAASTVLRAEKAALNRSRSRSRSQPPRPPPRQERIEIKRPERIAGCSAPERPPTLEGQTAELIRIRVRLVLSREGAVTRATVVEGHPLVEDDLILACVHTQQYEPPTLAGIPVPYAMSLVYTFRPDAEI